MRRGRGWWWTDDDTQIKIRPPSFHLKTCLYDQYEDQTNNLNIYCVCNIELVSNTWYLFNPQTVLILLRLNIDDAFENRSISIHSFTLKYGSERSETVSRRKCSTLSFYEHQTKYQREKKRKRYTTTTVFGHWSFFSLTFDLLPIQCDQLFWFACSERHKRKKTQTSAQPNKIFWFVCACVK